MKRIVLGAGALLAVLIALTFWWANDPVDRCLDHGGSWNYDREACDFERNHLGPKG